MSDQGDGVRRMIAAFNAGDKDALRECLHPQITVRRPLPDVGITSQPSDVGAYQGLEEVVSMLTELIRRTGGIHVDVRRVEEVGEDSALFEFIASLGPPGDSTTWLGWALFGFRDGLVASTETFGTEAQARAALPG